MKRREFLIATRRRCAGHMAAGCVLAAAGNTSGRGLIPTHSGDLAVKARVAAFDDQLKGHGWSQGRNIRIDYRFNRIPPRETSAQPPPNPSPPNPMPCSHSA